MRFVFVFSYIAAVGARCAPTNRAVAPCVSVPPCLRVRTVNSASSQAAISRAMHCSRTLKAHEYAATAHHAGSFADSNEIASGLFLAHPGIVLVEAPFNRITGDIIGAAVEVHRVLGPGLLESTYIQCLQYELSARKLRFVTQQALPLVYKGSFWMRATGLIWSLKIRSSSR